MNNTHFAYEGITHRRLHRSPKIANKTTRQVGDELFTQYRDVRVDFTAELDYHDSPTYCPDRICRTCGIDHDFRPDYRGTKTSIDEIAQILRVKTDGVT
jgi:hypothetical protein